MSLLYEAIQRVAKDYDANRTATGILFGKVKSEKPLRIEIDGKLTLEEKFLTLAQHLSDYEIPFEVLRASQAQHPGKRPTEWSGIREVEGHFVEHEGKRFVLVESGCIRDFKGQGTIKLHNHLRQGEVVILARMEGGHMYIVLDRVNTGNE